MPFLSTQEREITEKYLESDGTAKAERQIMKEVTGKAKPMPKAVKKKINDIFDDCGLSDEKLVRKLKTKLNAKKDIVVQSRSGTEVKKIQDHGTQIKALDMAFKIKGHMDGKDQGLGTTKLIIESDSSGDKARKLVSPKEEDVNPN